MDILLCFHYLCAHNPILVLACSVLHCPILHVNVTDVPPACLLPSVWIINPATEHVLVDEVREHLFADMAILLPPSSFSVCPSSTKEALCKLSICPDLSAYITTTMEHLSPTTSAPVLTIATAVSWQPLSPPSLPSASWLEDPLSPLPASLHSESQTPPQPVDPAAPPWLLASLSSPWPVSPKASPGSLVPPAPPWTPLLQLHLLPSSSTLVFCHSVSTVAFQVPASASVTRAICSTLALRILAVTLARQLSIYPPCAPLPPALTPSVGPWSCQLFLHHGHIHTVSFWD
ncbi:Triple functional domain protein [Labeo rohita]|uniref:Triple functional domain protein n=1 Tax=Labeo rohita TaxID=84645 RepID=A0ABQ8M513_LABRO|nr:Triple functional domain protein [Labeo rohita]